MQITTTPSRPGKQKSLGDPSASYESMRKLWEKSRAILNGHSQTKAYDEYLDTYNFTNLLIPFSPTMTTQQYNFYKAESELPGLTASYAKALLGGLLRKEATMVFPDEVPEGAESWLRSRFGSDGTTLHGFLDEAIWEELQSSRCWVLVDYPKVSNYDDLSAEERNLISPYAMVIKAENVINWRRGYSNIQNKQILTSVVFRYYMEDYSKDAFHPDYVDTVTHYYLDDQGLLTVDTYTRDTSESIKVVNGLLKEEYKTDTTSGAWVRVNTEFPLMNGERMSFIPAWPLNGQVDPVEPLLMPLVDREISLYNKVSRRNHLLYGAATYTPVVMSDMTEEEFDDIVSAGLGSWIKLRAGDDIKALETPTNSLKDMEASIENTVSEMARMGLRMLSPEGGSESGVSLEIRNASQTAQLGLLNNRISETLKDVIAVMVSWKYGIDVGSTEIDFDLTADFNPVPIGADWMRVLKEWYTEGIIPRSTFLQIAKQNDILPHDYNDEVGLQEIQDDPFINNRSNPVDESLLNNLGN